MLQARLLPPREKNIKYDTARLVHLLNLPFKNKKKKSNPRAYIPFPTATYPCEPGLSQAFRPLPHLSRGLSTQREMKPLGSEQVAVRWYLSGVIR